MTIYYYVSEKRKDYWIPVIDGLPADVAADLLGAMGKSSKGVQRKVIGKGLAGLLTRLGVQFVEVRR